MSIIKLGAPLLEKAFTMALFGDRWEDYIKDAVPTIQSLGAQVDQDFMVDIAVDRPEAQLVLTGLFKKYAGHISPENGRLNFIGLPKGVDNKTAAHIRFGKYLTDAGGPIRILFAADLDDILEPLYTRKMTVTIDDGAPVAIANQIKFKLGADWRGGQSVQIPRFECGHRFDLQQIIDFNIAGFCNIALNLQSGFFGQNSHDVLLKATNKQLDRAFIACAFAYGAYGILSEADMGYGQGNGFYGQDKTSLESEMNMQVHLTRLLKELDGLSPEVLQLITTRNDIDEDLVVIRDGGGLLYATYRMLVAEEHEELRSRGFQRQWGEQVIPRTREYIEATIPYYATTQMQLA